MGYHDGRLNKTNHNDPYRPLVVLHGSVTGSNEAGLFYGMGKGQVLNILTLRNDNTSSMPSLSNLKERKGGLAKKREVQTGEEKEVKR